MIRTHTNMNCPYCDLPLKDDDYVIVPYFGRQIIMVASNSPHQCDIEVVKANWLDSGRTL